MKKKYNTTHCILYLKIFLDNPSDSKQTTHMTKLYSFCAIIITTVSLTAGPTITHGTSTYTLVNDKPYTWHEAKVKAESLGGHLATITSKEENDVVFNKLNLNGLNPWLGATDEKSEGQWRWITGETWTYTNWGGHGNDNANGNEHYLHFHAYFPSQWGDHKSVMFHTVGDGKGCFILETPHKQIINNKPNTYELTKFIPSGFSMIQIPFSYQNNSIQAIFGAGHDFVIYEYTFTKDFFHGEWVINAYDSDFEEWDYPSHVLPAGTAVWILNNSPFVKMIEFKGHIPKNWKNVKSTVRIP